METSKAGLIPTIQQGKQHGLPSLGHTLGNACVLTCELKDFITTTAALL